MGNWRGPNAFYDIDPPKETAPKEKEDTMNVGYRHHHEHWHSEDELPIHYPGHAEFHKSPTPVPPPAPEPPLLSVGDYVKVIPGKHVGPAYSAADGLYGKIIQVRPPTYLNFDYAVEFAEMRPGFSACSEITPPNHGYYLYADQVTQVA